MQLLQQPHTSACCQVVVGMLTLECRASCGLVLTHTLHTVQAAHRPCWLRGILHGMLRDCCFVGAVECSSIQKFQVGVVYGRDSWTVSACRGVGKRPKVVQPAGAVGYNQLLLLPVCGACVHN